jgi:hypothetical protein
VLEHVFLVDREEEERLQADEDVVQLKMNDNFERVSTLTLEFTRNQSYKTLAEPLPP